MMDHLETLVHRYVLVAEQPATDLCRKAEITMIEILGKHGSLIMSELADHARICLSTTTGVIDGLVTKALVDRQRSDQDRRIVRVELTAAGRKIYEQAVDVRLRMVRGMLGALNKEEQDTFVSLFRKIVDRIDREKRATVA